MTDEQLAQTRTELARMRQQLYSASQRNEALTKTLRQARDEIQRIRGEAQALTEPPNSYATVIEAIPDHKCDVHYAGRKMRLSVAPEVPRDKLEAGRTVLLSEGLAIIDVLDYMTTGSVVSVRDVVGERVVVGGVNDDEQVFTLAQPLRGITVRPGDSLLVDTKTHFAYERIEKPESNQLLLEEVPDISYSDIGGLDHQIEEIQDAVELPFEHPELYAQHGLKPPKGILLYGPPGCGKTLIAKAVANSLAKRRQDASTQSYFLNIKGPELLDKYVGETERQLRQIFARAREKATAGSPVVVFFDEMESLFRTRGTGKSSDVETTVVPQLLAEIDGVEKLENVIVIGASNREDLIDPAILRPGRLDVKIRIERPDKAGAYDIFSKYLTPDLPIHTSGITTTVEEAVNGLIAKCVEYMFARTDDNRFVTLTYTTGEKEVLYFADFASGAMISNVVDRAKKHAIKSLLSTGKRGITWTHLQQAIREEFREHEDLPNTSNPDEWARISGKKGERITHMSMF